MLIGIHNISVEIIDRIVIVLFLELCYTHSALAFLTDSQVNNNLVVCPMI